MKSKEYMYVCMYGIHEAKKERKKERLLCMVYVHEVKNVCMYE